MLVERYKHFLYSLAVLVPLFVLFAIASDPSAPGPVESDPRDIGALVIIPPSETPPAPSEAPIVTTPVSDHATSSLPPPASPSRLSKPAAVKVQTVVPSDQPTTSATEVSAGLDAAAVALRSALVNIICYAPAGSGIRSISGSGVIVDPQGIILTNAHIAQYHLLGERGVSCRVRAGSPAADRYVAELIYLPTQWIKNNGSLLTADNPSGTGEYDFALLGITKSATAAALPATFPSVPIAKLPLVALAPVVIGSYGAQFLQPSQIQSDLFPTIVFGSVKEIFTFAKNTIDILALGGSAAAQEGSSGGGVANYLGELAATITTSTMEGDTSSRQLHAITASYVRAAYASETGKPLDLLLSAPITEAVTAFSAQARALEAALAAYIP